MAGLCPSAQIYCVPSDKILFVANQLCCLDWSYSHNCRLSLIIQGGFIKFGLSQLIILRLLEQANLLLPALVCSVVCILVSSKRLLGWSKPSWKDRCLEAVVDSSCSCLIKGSFLPLSCLEDNYVLSTGKNTWFLYEKYKPRSPTSTHSI